jgi:Patatin-like phospholipase
MVNGSTFLPYSGTSNGAALRILSLDGGGVRGLSSLYMLKELMAQAARQKAHDQPTEPNSVLHPCEIFDLICGTSTGGLIALMLGRLEMVPFSERPLTLDRRRLHQSVPRFGFEGVYVQIEGKHVEVRPYNSRERDSESYSGSKAGCRRFAFTPGRYVQNVCGCNPRSSGWKSCVDADI